MSAWPSTGFTWRTLAVLSALAGSAAPARSQVAGIDAPTGEELVASAVSAGAPPSCVAALPPSAFRRTGVYVVADHAGEPFPRIPDAGRVSVQLATETIAWRTRALLGAPEGLLPPPDTVINWQNVGRHLHVVGHRDGRMTWSYPWDTPGHRPSRDSVGEVALALLGRGVDSAIARNERFAWSPGVEGDSIPFLIRLDYPGVDEKGKPEPMRGLHAAALLEIRAPSSTPVALRKMAAIRYPELARKSGVSGTIMMQFVVDTTGRPVEPSIRDLWPEDKPRPQGFLGQHYGAFLAAVKRGLSGSEYRPARLGGCAVAQLVQQPFTFELAR